MHCKQIILSRHAVQRMFTRGIPVSEVESVIQQGQMIEDYPDDHPYPSCLLLGESPEIPLHVVVAMDEGDGRCIVVTTYRPSPDQWHLDNKTRKP
ncbi:hypothetical protein BBC27_00200 [Acidithiobacillus ferrivorans]|uniref:DUF4258 domain-containing protein n=2 Tax=Acidithiobacillus ferrivorans TaxID=160808 RepID=A0A1B9C2A9_9PROT|nr:DUF4258 domain-containing protein [Acidithiobacillus ferrivorans]OCB04010.1 hypothetical protein BBC27_00200 [Acidithiobacillus ferrivorans]